MKQIKQNQMTSECWEVQFWGIDACNNCEYLNTEDCGGQDILKTGKNGKGFKVPL